MIAEFPSDTRYVRDAKLPWWTRPADRGDHYFPVKSGKGLELKNGTTYFFTVSAVKGQAHADSPVVQAIPEPNWVNWNAVNNLLVVLLFGAVLAGSIYAAKRREIFLRRIPGLDAVDEAIGRATELGKPVLYMTGAHDMNDPATIAAAIILGRVAKKAGLLRNGIAGAAPRTHHHGRVPGNYQTSLSGSRQAGSVQGRRQLFHYQRPIQLYRGRGRHHAPAKNRRRIFSWGRTSRNRSY